MINKKISLVIVIFALIVVFIGCAGCGSGGGSAVPTPATERTRNNERFGDFFPESAYIEKAKVVDLSQKTMDLAALRSTNCTWHDQMTIPQDSATSLIHAMQSILPYAKNDGYIEKSLHSRGEIVMVLAGYRGAGVGAEYSNHQVVLYEESNLMMGDRAVLQIAHELGHMQDQGYDPNEFISYLFGAVIPIVAYNNNPIEYCQDNWQKNPLQEMIADFANYAYVDYVHERGYIATMLLIRNDGGDIQKMISDASDPTTFNQYLDNADSFISQSASSDFSKLYCDSVTVLLEKNVADTSFTGSMLSWVKCK